MDVMIRQIYKKNSPFFQNADPGFVLEMSLMFLPFFFFRRWPWAVGLQPGL